MAPSQYLTHVQVGMGWEDGRSIEQWVGMTLKEGRGEWRRKCVRRWEEDAAGPSSVLPLFFTPFLLFLLLGQQVQGLHMDSGSAPPFFMAVLRRSCFCFSWLTSICLLPQSFIFQRSCWWRSSGHPSTALLFCNRERRVAKLEITFTYCIRPKLEMTSSPQTCLENWFQFQLVWVLTGNLLFWWNLGQIWVMIFSQAHKLGQNTIFDSNTGSINRSVLVHRHKKMPHFCPSITVLNVCWVRSSMMMMTGVAVKTAVRYHRWSSTVLCIVWKLHVCICIWGWGLINALRLSGVCL